jgi:hypothetical protein
MTKHAGVNAETAGEIRQRSSGRQCGCWRLSSIRGAIQLQIISVMTEQSCPPSCVEHVRCQLCDGMPQGRKEQLGITALG